MEMACNNLCNSCTNIGCIVKNESAFYIPPHVEPDNCGNYVVMQPTVEAIPKAEYEARLKSKSGDIVVTKGRCIEVPDNMTEKEVDEKIKELYK